LISILQQREPSTLSLLSIAISIALSVFVVVLAAVWITMVLASNSRRRPMGTFARAMTLVGLTSLVLMMATSVQGFVPATQQQRRMVSSSSASIAASSPTRLSASVTIEREDVLVIPRVQEERETAATEERRSGQGREAWEVRIYNDGLNTREHVARCLVQVTGLSELQAYSTMMLAHHQGMASVGQYAYEVAECYHDALRSKGIICDIIPIDGQD
jgi:ATP-dependent Clp protease adapter protein ClpS